MATASASSLPIATISIAVLKLSWSVGRLQAPAPRPTRANFVLSGAKHHIGRVQLAVRRTGGRMSIGVGRRQFLSALGGAATAWPLLAHAQQPGMPVIGFIESAGLPKQTITSFLNGLNEQGYDNGRNVIIEYLAAEADTKRLPGLITDLVHRMARVIVTDSPGAAVSLDHPGGNHSSRARSNASQRCEPACHPEHLSISLLCCGGRPDKLWSQLS